MKAETDDVAAHDVTTTFREEFYCRNCGYVPDWRPEGVRGARASREAACVKE